MRDKIPVYEPDLSGNELAYVTDCLRSGWISSLGQYVGRFEETFSRFCGAKYGVSTANGTVALHLALLTLGIGPGDEVRVRERGMVSLEAKRKIVRPGTVRCK